MHGDDLLMATDDLLADMDDLITDVDPIKDVDEPITNVDDPDDVLAELFADQLINDMILNWEATNPNLKKYLENHAVKPINGMFDIFDPMNATEEVCLIEGDGRFRVELTHQYTVGQLPILRNTQGINPDQARWMPRLGDILLRKFFSRRKSAGLGCEVNWEGGLSGVVRDFRALPLVQQLTLVARHVAREPALRRNPRAERPFKFRTQWTVPHHMIDLGIVMPWEDGKLQVLTFSLDFSEPGARTWLDNIFRMVLHAKSGYELDEDLFQV
ncbi:hypothetical protein F4802DRAFT_343006 [Xylaria palmicola]|nr:hypothetical protein F4802DRAFT_343006 [Xylaria palmicola]